jgi:squalene synthase HpnC
VSDLRVGAVATNGTSDVAADVELDRDLPDAEVVMTRATGENFSVASYVLGRRARRHLRAIYGFARFVDDIGDAAPGDRLALLDLVERDLERVFVGEPTQPLLRALVPTVRELQLPPEPFHRLIEANRQDQLVTRYASFEELRAYCALSADPVGELVLHVFGRATPERIALSDRVCTGLQVVEHLQDVGEDYAQGRIYLPLDDMARFEVDEAVFGGARVSEPLRALLAFESERARSLLEAGVPLIRSLRGRARLAVAAYVGGGRAALRALAEADYDVLGTSPRPSRARRALETLEALG